MYFLAERTDGLGERLRAIVNAVFLADRFDTKYFFDWKTKTGKQAGYHAICSIGELFEASYLGDHAVSLNEKELRNKVEIQADSLEKYLHAQKSISNIIVKVHQGPLYRYLPSLKRELQNKGLARSFQSIQFTSPMREAINCAASVSVATSCIAVHLRAGDIVYGRQGLHARFLDKVIPYQLAGELISRLVSNGDLVLLFGQDKQLINYLIQKYGVYAASTLLPSDLYDPTQQALAEIILMSRCRAIFSGSSGFSQLASSLAGDIRTSIYTVINRSPDLVLCSLDAPLAPDIPIKQHIFSMRWVIAMHAASLSLDTIRQVCCAGLILAPNDPFFSYVLASAYIAEGNFERAVAIIEPIRAQAAPSMLSSLLNPRSYRSRQSAERILSPLYSFLGLGPFD